MILFSEGGNKRNNNRLTSIVEGFLEKSSRRENIKEMFCFDLNSIIVLREGVCSLSVKSSITSG